MKTDFEGQNITGYKMLLALRDAAKARKTVISITNICGDVWVVTESDQQTKQPRQLGKAEHGLFEALESAGDFNTTYK